MLNGHSNAKWHGHTRAVFRHGSVYTCLYIGINAKEHNLYFSGELLGSIKAITINRSFHRTFSKLKYKHLLMLTTLLKHSWAENTIFKQGNWNKWFCDSNKDDSSSSVLTAATSFCSVVFLDHRFWQYLPPIKNQKMHKHTLILDRKYSYSLLNKNFSKIRSYAGIFQMQECVWELYGISDALQWLQCMCKTPQI